jgi:hypothetical protein
MDASRAASIGTVSQTGATSTFRLPRRRRYHAFPHSAGPDPHVAGGGVSAEHEHLGGLRREVRVVDEEEGGECQDADQSQRELIAEHF